MTLALPKGEPFLFLHAVIHAPICHTALKQHNRIKCQQSQQHDKCHSILLLHNHPSGDPSPSREDMLLTKRIRDVGQMIGIELVDHIVIGDNRYTSFRESGYL